MPDDPTDVAPTEAGSIPPEDSPVRAYAGYQVVRRLGLGGMGEVLLGHHAEIGRDIAIKRMRADEPSPEQVARFLREAKIQARLEHPAIVPVHELGHDARGLPYFTMKRLAGVTLTHALAHPDVWSRQRLLRAFVDVCRAVDFAHDAKVIHRDLKPANVVLGDFGEVYVLDWGVARADGADDVPSVTGDLGASDMTQEGAMLGTPGYMSPEQVEAAHEAGAPTDVYALGAILFEILAGERLHPGGKAGVVRAYQGEVEAPTARRPERNVPPELDALCLAMLARQPAARPTVREVAERIDRFLDGDRDVARRKALAAEHLAAAKTAAKDPHRRIEAMRAANRALGLDPELQPAAELLGVLALQPPAEPPPELQAELADEAVRGQRRHARHAYLALGSIAVFLCAAALAGARNWPLFAAIALHTAFLSTLSFLVSRRGASSRAMFAIVFVNASLAAMLSRVFGPFVIAPGVVGAMAMSLTSYPQLIARGRLVVAILIAGWLAPIALEQFGVLAPTWRIDDGEIVSMSAVLWIGASGRLLVIFAHLVLIGATGLFAHAIASGRAMAQRQIHIQAWQLRQLLP